MNNLNKQVLTMIISFLLISSASFAQGKPQISLSEKLAELGDRPFTLEEKNCSDNIS